MRFEKAFLIIIILIASFLRFYKLDVIPPGLYIDEISIGNNAYSILRSGKDEYGQLHPLWFKSFGDYKMPVYIYSVSISMALFGKNEFSVRFPSALSGALTVLILYLFLKELLRLDYKNNKKFINTLPILSSFLLAFSSWHIQFSRGGFEVNMAVFFYLLAFFIFLTFLTKKNTLLLLLSFIIFTISIYTYHSFRIITPVTVLIIALYIFKKLPHFRLRFMAALLFFTMLITPVILFSFTQQGLIRFKDTSAFVEYPTESMVIKIILYPMVYVKNYLSYFSFHNLFIFGDGNGRHQMSGFGLLYRWQFLFLIMGIYYLFKSKSNLVKNIIFLLLLISPMAAAVARPSPHSLRSLLMVIPLLTIVSYGVIASFQAFRHKFKKVFILIFLFAFYELFYYFHFYYIHYPQVNIIDWGGGYRQIVETTKKYKYAYSHIVVDKNLNYALLYFDFYDNSIKFETVNVDWKKPGEWEEKKTLYIRPYYGHQAEHIVVDEIRLFNANKDIFAQFLRL